MLIFLRGFIRVWPVLFTLHQLPAQGGRKGSEQFEGPLARFYKLSTAHWRIQHSKRPCFGKLAALALAACFEAALVALLELQRAACDWGLPEVPEPV